MTTNPANDIQQCIQKCQNAAQQLENMANQETNVQIKSMLKEAAHHLDLCIEECQFSMEAVQNFTM
jgi:CRISPR/Cas system CMR-associated protein Cmr1 (group 7 of RAMP superfamily)